MQKLSQNIKLKRNHYLNIWSQQVIAFAIKFRYYKKITRTLGKEYSFREKNRIRFSFTFNYIS